MLWRRLGLLLFFPFFVFAQGGMVNLDGTVEPATPESHTEAGVCDEKCKKKLIQSGSPMIEGLLIDAKAIREATDGVRQQVVQQNGEDEKEKKVLEAKKSKGVKPLDFKIGKKGEVIKIRRKGKIYYETPF